MTPRKNPAAVALGRLGGKATGRKGFAAMSPARREEIRAKALVTRRQNMRARRMSLGLGSAARRPALKKSLTPPANDA
jgi:hypothetical protein